MILILEPIAIPLLRYPV